MAIKPIRLTIYDPDKDRHYSAIKILPLSDEGFSIIFPRFVDSNEGKLEKINLEYVDYGTKINVTRNNTAQYHADDIVKFSYHEDGFVQFSSATNNKIISGKYTNGKPKGLGVQSWPLSDPISTGPSFTLSIWGLDNLAEQSTKKIDPRFIFRTDAAKTDNAHSSGNRKRELFAMEVFVLKSKSAEQSIVGSNNDGSENAFMSMMQDREDLSFFLRMRRLVRIVRLPNPNVVLGISWMRFLIDDNNKSDHGYYFGGPSDGKSSLLATYPLNASDIESPLKDIMYRGVASSG